MSAARSLMPNFFILGAGRCGTTTLAKTLGSHPDIFIPELKEPSFFSSSFRWVSDPAAYVDLYRDGSGAQARGDASHIYLEDPETPDVLAAFFPEARFVAIFRDPVDRALALYAFMVQHGYEVHRTFERALAAEDRRFSSERFRRTCPHSFWNFMYYRSGLFGEQVDRYLTRFPSDAFYFTTLDELSTSPDRVLGEIHKHLGLDPLAVGRLGRDGTSKSVRSIGLQYLERRVLRPVARRAGDRAENFREAVTAWNTVRVKPTMLDSTRERLAAQFAPDVVRLRELTGVDLTLRGDQRP